MPEFDIDSGKRIASVVRWTENTRRNEVKRMRRPSFHPYAKLGITTTAITGRVGKTPGFCTVQPYIFNGTIFVISPLTTEKVYNWTGSTVSSTTSWVEYQERDGYLWLTGIDCSGVAP